MYSRISGLELCVNTLKFSLFLGVSIKRENFRREIRCEKVRQNGPFYTTSIGIAKILLLPY